eukprot:SM000146S00974  [mRNA]  locus=s146:287898:289094:+ [translate_table: standard]
MVHWEAAAATAGGGSAAVDGFEVQRQGREEFTARVTLELADAPERFRLSPGLAVIVGSPSATRPRALAALWHYVRDRRLQDAGDPAAVACDGPLRQLFGGEARLRLASFSARLAPHLLPLEPVELQHRVTLDPACPAPAADVCYDIPVDIPHPLQRDMVAFLAGAERHQNLDVLDEHIARLAARLGEHRRRHAFFSGFSQSPVDFIRALIASQSRDLRIAATGASGAGGRSAAAAARERRCNFYNQPWVEDAVVRYLQRRVVSGTDQPNG